jgi:hypothetical protein
MSERDKWIERAGQAAEILRRVANELDGVDSAFGFGNALTRLNEIGAIGSDIEDEIVERGGPTGPVNA